RRATGATRLKTATAAATPRSTPARERTAAEIPRRVCAIAVEAVVIVCSGLRPPPVAGTTRSSIEAMSLSEEGLDGHGNRRHWRRSSQSGRPGTHTGAPGATRPLAGPQWFEDIARRLSRVESTLPCELRCPDRRSFPTRKNWNR